MTQRNRTKIHLVVFAILMAVGLLGVQVFADTINGPFYKVEVKKSKKKDKNVATITITGTKGYHCNKLYPWKLKINPVDGLKFEKDTYTKKDAKQFSEKVVVFEVVYTGDKKASANLKMSLCNEKQCDRAKVDVTW